jgi:putative integral membrane protein (TIGR02587 family)
VASDGGAAVSSKLWRGLGRAFGGALIFGLPMLMTNEFWELGASMDRLRLVLLVALSVPLLVGVAHRVGFEATFGWQEDLRDAFIALGVGVVATALILGLFNLVDTAMSRDAAVGRIAVQGVPAALGAMLARSQFGTPGRDGQDGRRALDGYGGALFMMVVGSLFLCLNIAPTVEVIEIAYRMTPWHALAAVALTIAVMHAFVSGHGVSSRGDMPWWGDLLRFTLVGYVLALAICLFALWTFGRIDGIGAGRLAMTLVVLGFPAGLGAAAARLLL